MTLPVPGAIDQLNIQFLPSFVPQPQATHVIFDFDGTLSWIRHGWPEIMQQVMSPRFPLKDGETKKDIREYLFEQMYRFNGQPTPLFMAEMAREIQSRSNEADPDEMFQSFLAVLNKGAHERHENIRSKKCPPDDYIVFGGRAFIETLIEAGLKVIILSGNPNDQVNKEADLLNLSRYCNGHVYGHTDAENFSKQFIMEKLMDEEGFSGENLIAIGDGAAEIKATKALGGLAVAICSDEEVNGSGVIDENKLPILLDGGADCVIADYREPDNLLNLLTGK
ncbi:MAG: HAD family hydrolase [Verrucomicrobiota bacterium]|nr:HAD family hydrolase [Verrucomicrobiota bacterium]